MKLAGLGNHRLIWFGPSRADRERDIAPMKRIAVHYFLKAFTRQYRRLDGISHREEPEALSPRLVDLGAHNKGIVKNDLDRKQIPA